MEKTLMIVRKRVEGKVEYNDSEFAEIQTNGIEGIEKDLLLETIQIHRCDSGYSSEEFQQKFSVGTWLDILTITRISPSLTKTEDESPRKRSVSEKSARFNRSG
jgi:hypothetical protein